MRLLVIQTRFDFSKGGRSSLICGPRPPSATLEGQPNDHFMALPDILLEPTRLTCQGAWNRTRS